MLNNLKPLNSKKNKKNRVGRGYGSGHGGHTATRGTKGQKSRTGHKKMPWYFEGGQLPLVKRLPHLRGFISYNKKTPIIVKTSQLNVLTETSLNPKKLVELGVIKKLNRHGVKILKDVEVNKKINLVGFRYSKSAKESIEKSKGSAN